MKIFLNFDSDVNSIYNHNLYKTYLEKKLELRNISSINHDKFKEHFKLKYLNIINYELCLPYLLGKEYENSGWILYLNTSFNFIKNINEIEKNINNNKLYFYILGENNKVNFLLINTKNENWKDIDIVKLHNLNNEALLKLIYNKKNTNIDIYDNKNCLCSNNENNKIKDSILNNLNSIEKKILKYQKKNKILYVTSFNKKLYEEYGKDFIKTFNFEGDLILFSEENLNFIHDENQINYNLLIGNLFEVDKGFLKFVQRNKERNIVDAAKGFRYNTIRFSYKVFSLINAFKYMKNKKYEYMVWLDGDMVFKKKLNYEFVKNKLTDNKSLISYLGRKSGRCYSECGFLIFNLNHLLFKKYIYEVRDCYLTDKIYELDEWHDSYIWDYFRIKFQIEHKVENFNITTRFGGNQGVNHIINETPLKDYMDHLKGDIRKEIKTSSNNKLYNKLKKKKDSELPNKPDHKYTGPKPKLFDVIKSQLKDKNRIRKIENKKKQSKKNN